MSSPATLLLVDDEVNILKALTRLLRPAGYQLLTAENGAEALTLLARQPVDLVPFWICVSPIGAATVNGWRCWPSVWPRRQAWHPRRWMR